MKTMRRALWGVLVLASACGGDSGGGGSESPRLTGSFKVVGMESEATPVADSTSLWGSGEADGLVLSLLLAANSNGVVSGPAPDALGIALDADGTIHLRDTATAEEVLRGFVAGADQSTIVAGGVRPGDIPRVLLATRAWSGTAAGSDLAGGYHGVLFRFDGSAASGVLAATFDGVDSGSLPAGGVFNTDGTLSTSNFTSLVSYSVAPDGLVTLGAGFGATAFQGGLHTSRDLVVMAGSISSGFQGLFALVRNAAGATNGTFSGEYRMVGLVFDYTAPALRSFTGLLTSDGTGGATFEGTTNVEGAVGAAGAALASYSVAADGALDLAAPGGTLSGGVSSSGDFAVLGGPTTAGSAPAIYVLVR